MIINLIMAAMLFVLGYMGGLTVLAGLGIIGVVSTFISATVCISTGVVAAFSPALIKA